MPFYYVKNGGTATGDQGRVTTQRTGTWSVTTSEYYDTIEDARNATTVPIDGDFILCSDLHSISYANSSFVLNGGGAASGAGLAVISVDDANQENYKPGALERLTNAVGNIDVDNIVFFAGVSLEGSSSAILGTVAGSRFCKLQDCRIERENALPVLSANEDGMAWEFINVDIEGFSGGARPISVRNGGRIYWRGGTLINNAGGLVSAAADNGGVSYIFEGVDLSVQSGTLLDTALSASTSDVFLLKLINCQLHASVTLPGDTDLKLPQHRFEMWGCDDSAGGELFRYHMQDGTGKVVNNNSKFVTNENVWYGGSPEVRSSYEVSTTAICSHVFPFVFNLPLEYVDLTDSNSDVIRVLVASTLTLTDTELVAYLVYPDGTTKVQPNWITSGKVVSPTGSPERINYGIDPLAAGTELPTSTAIWTDPGSPQLANKYHLELDTTVDPGAAGPVAVRIEIYRASIVAGELYLATEYEKA